jgi:hypothetical protein
MIRLKGEKSNIGFELKDGFSPRDGTSEKRRRPRLRKDWVEDALRPCAALKKL